MVLTMNKQTNTIKSTRLFIALSVALGLTACGGSGEKSDTTTPPEPPQVQYPDYADVSLLGGDTTTLDASLSGHGFSTPAPNLTASELEHHLEGDKAFETSFTRAPNTNNPELDGLGPVFNNINCNACHQRDGRNSTPVVPEGQTRLLLDSSAGIFLRISKAPDQICTEGTADNNYCAPIPVPDFGGQLFHRGLINARPDWDQQDADGNQPNLFKGQADVYLSYEYTDITYPDGTTVKLKKPLFEVENPYDSPSNPAVSQLLQSDVLMGWRNGMPVFGLGLLEAIPESSILANADVNDADNDGISGKPNYVFDKVKADAGDEHPVSLGRFGWKANTPSVRVQSLGALRGDIGVTNPLFPEESVAGTALHESYLTRTGFVDTGKDENDAPEADVVFSDGVVFYSETLAVPARRNIEDTDVREGARLFDDINCVSCHTPKFVTKSTGDIGGTPIIDALKNQTIYPFTDMLLHDMGEELADGRPDFLASGNEWRTRPLWGIGLTRTVNPLAGFLHDGRAANIEEAILWHGGEAEKSRNDFMALTATERKQLIKFVNSL